jgi:hypothetical protein
MRTIIAALLVFVGCAGTSVAGDKPTPTRPPNTNTLRVTPVPPSQNLLVTPERVTVLDGFPMVVVEKDPSLYPIHIAGGDPRDYPIRVIRPAGVRLETTYQPLQQQRVAPRVAPSR